MIGTNTAINDNPELTVREVKGKNPLRVVIDLDLRLPENLNIFDGSTPTLIVNSIKSDTNQNIEFLKIDKNKEFPTNL